MIKYRTTEANICVPYRSTPGAAGYDLFAARDRVLTPFDKINGQATLVPTGVIFEIPTGWVGLIRDRSSVALNRGLVVVAGVIDSDFRGQTMVALQNLSGVPIPIAKGNRIAQILFVPCYMGELEEADLSATERGANGFGSTGV